MMATNPELLGEHIGSNDERATRTTVGTNVSPSRPLVRYHGGKWRLAPWIISQFPAHRVYVEPFGGAASVLIRKRRSHAEIYNDLDGEIVNLFRVARDQGAALQRSLELTPFSRLEFETSYDSSADSLEQARRTVVRAFLGFGSNAHARPTGFRADSNRSSTTPAMDWRHYPAKFGALIDRLRGVVIENRPAHQVMAAHDEADCLHYVDPPYVSSTRDRGADYRHEMSDSDHRELATFLQDLRGMVVVSGYDSSLYEELYAGWRRIERKALADHGSTRTEVLWLRNCPETIPDLFAPLPFADLKEP